MKIPPAVGTYAAVDHEGRFDNHHAVECPSCAAVNVRDAVRCSSCDEPLTVASLVVVAGRLPERVFFLRPRRYSLGRSHENDLVLTEPSVSKSHAWLHYEAGQFSVQDRDSLHGVYVNGAKVKKTPLTPGCEITFGNVRLLFVKGGPDGVTTDPKVRLPLIEHQQLLLSLVQAINASLDLNEVLDRVLDALVRVTGAERGFLLLADEGSGPIVAGLTLRVGRRRDGTAVMLDRPGLSTSVIRRAIETQELVATSNAASDPMLAEAESVIHHQLRTIVCVPLRSIDYDPDDTSVRRASVLGALYVDNPTTSIPFSEDTLGAASALARHAALAIQNAQLFESVHGGLEELKRAQRQLLQAEKLATIGQMASAIVHELNTPLTYILGCVELMLGAELLPGQEQRLSQIQVGAEKIESLTRNLLAFSRPAAEDRGPVSANALVERSLELCRYQILKAGVSVEKALDPELPNINGISSQIEMALINLIVNAVRATPPGGRLRLTTGRVKGQVEITVSDTGCGIPAVIRDKIFQPFITTRPEGEGTGLGLSTVARVVEQHSGEIHFTTEEGHGTTFRLTLPASECPAIEPPKVSE